MYFRAFLSLFFSSFKTCAILGFLLGVAVALKAVVVWGESFSAIARDLGMDCPRNQYEHAAAGDFYLYPF